VALLYDLLQLALGAYWPTFQHCLKTEREDMLVEGVDRDTTSYGGEDTEVLPYLKVRGQCPVALQVKVELNLSGA
jgi:hypothetical protein